MRAPYDGKGLSAFLTKLIDQEILLDQIRAIAGLGSVNGRTKTGKAPPSDNAKNDDAERLPALFDNERLGELREAVGQKRLSEMFALLDAELATRPDEIAALVKAGDRDGALRLAHSLKGAAGSAGALAVAALAEQFEAKDVSLQAVAQRLCATAARTRKAIVALDDDSARRSAHG